MQHGKVILVLVFGLFPGLAAGPAGGEEALSARQIIERSIAANGGEAWARPRTLYLEGEAYFYTDGLYDQATHVTSYRMWRVYPRQSSEAHVANGMVRFDAYAGNTRVFQISFDGENSYDENGLVEDEAANEQWANAFGFGILRFALEEGFTLMRLADDSVDGHPAHLVRIVDPAGSETIFGIDRESFAIRMVGFDTPRGWHHRLYSDFAWHEDPRFRQPRRVRLYYNGRMTNDIDWQIYHVNQPIDRTVFVLPDSQ